MDSEVGAGPKKLEGMGWRVSVSIITFFGAVVAAILWLFFYAGNFNVYQNIAIIVVIFLAFIAVMGATWASWGMRQSEWWERRSSTSSSRSAPGLPSAADGPSDNLLGRTG